MIEPKYENMKQMFELRAAETPEQPYIAYCDRELTFGELGDRSARLANALLELGVQKGDIVYLYMNNCPEYMIAVAAAARIGAVAGPTNSWLKGAEIAYQYNDSKGKAAIVDAQFLNIVDDVRPHCPNLKHVVVNDGGRPVDGRLNLSQLIEGHAPNLPDIQIGRNDLAFIFYTSGTTGSPKGALLTHRNIVFEIACVLDRLKMMEEAPENIVGLVFLPLFHVNAMMTLLAVVYRHTKIVLLPKFSIREFGPAVERHRVAFFGGVPKVYRILLEAADTVKANDLSSLQFGLCGAAPMTVETIREFEAAYGVEIIEGYGLTEGVVTSTMQPRGGMKKIGSIGPAVRGQEVKIFNERDEELAPGEIGEICIRGDNVMAGYLGKEEATRETLRGGWLHTGDLGHSDRDGYIYIVGREKDMIIKGGENIYPKEIENVLAEHPDIYDAAVIGVPDKMSGEEVKAFVVPKIGAEPTEAGVIDFCAERLADFKVPKEVEFVCGLPSSAIGKALKRQLREGKGVVRIDDLMADGVSQNLEAAFASMKDRFKPNRAQGWTAAIQYRIFGPGGGEWVVRVENGALSFEPGEDDAATSVVKMRAPTFAQIAERKLNVVEAINSGLAQIEGRESDLERLAEATS